MFNPPRYSAAFAMMLRPALLAMLAAAPAIAGDTPAAVTRWSFHEHIVIRIPRFREQRSRAAVSDAPVLRWKEKRGPSCLGADEIAAATIGASDAVDLLMGDGKRMRARLGQDCPALDFYQGFYVRRAVDGKLCATRDAIRSRSGAVCPIRDFRRLVAARWR